MLSKEDNELLTRTDRRVPMGEVFRQFRQPALLSEELPGTQPGAGQDARGSSPSIMWAPSVEVDPDSPASSTA